MVDPPPPNGPTRPRALVTGAARRVGRAVAVELAAAGFEVAVHFRSSAEAAAEVVGACRAAGGEAWSVAADLGDPDQVASLVGTVSARWDHLHLLVNNASLFSSVPFAEITDEVWAEMLAVNLRAPFQLSRGLLPLLAAADATGLGAPADQHGLVVHLCDIGADRPISRHAHYSVSKAGLVMLVRAMAVELAPTVRSVGISPGQVAWPADYDSERRNKLERRIPMGRAGSEPDVARLIRFLVTEGHYVNGCIIPVDGGLAARY